MIEKVVNEDGSFVPTWPGTKPAAGSEAFAEQATKPLRSLWVGNISPQMAVNLQRIFGQYLAGDITLEQATADVQKELDQGVQDYQTNNNVDLSKY